MIIYSEKGLYQFIDDTWYHVEGGIQGKALIPGQVYPGFTIQPPADPRTDYHDASKWHMTRIAFTLVTQNNQLQLIRCRRTKHGRLCYERYIRPIWHIIRAADAKTTDTGQQPLSSAIPALPDDLRRDFFDGYRAARTIQFLSGLRDYDVREFDLHALCYLSDQFRHYSTASRRFQFVASILWAENSTSPESLKSGLHGLAQKNILNHRITGLTQWCTEGTSPEQYRYDALKTDFASELKTVRMFIALVPNSKILRKYEDLFEHAEKLRQNQVHINHTVWARALKTAQDSFGPQRKKHWLRKPQYFYDVLLTANGLHRKDQSFIDLQEAMQLVIRFYPDQYVKLYLHDIDQIQWGIPKGTAPAKADAEFFIRMCEVYDDPRLMLPESSLYTSVTKFAQSVVEAKSQTPLIQRRLNALELGMSMCLDQYGETNNAFTILKQIATDEQAIASYDKNERSTLADKVRQINAAAAREKDENHEISINDLLCRHNAHDGTRKVTHFGRHLLDVIKNVACATDKSQVICDFASRSSDEPPETFMRCLARYELYLRTQLSLLPMYRPSLNMVEFLIAAIDLLPDRRAAIFLTIQRRLRNRPDDMGIVFKGIFHHFSSDMLMAFFGDNNNYRHPMALPQPSVASTDMKSALVDGFEKIHALPAKEGLPVLAVLVQCLSWASGYMNYPGMLDRERHSLKRFLPDIDAMRKLCFSLPAPLLIHIKQLADTVGVNIFDVSNHSNFEAAMLIHWSENFLKAEKMCLLRSLRDQFLVNQNHVMAIYATYKAELELMHVISTQSADNRRCKVILNTIEALSGDPTPLSGKPVCAIYTDNNEVVTDQGVLERLAIEKIQVLYRNASSLLFNDRRAICRDNPSLPFLLQAVQTRAARNRGRASAKVLRILKAEPSLAVKEDLLSRMFSISKCILKKQPGAQRPSEPVDDTGLTR